MAPHGNRHTISTFAVCVASKESEKRLKLKMAAVLYWYVKAVTSDAATPTGGGGAAKG